MDTEFTDTGVFAFQIMIAFRLHFTECDIIERFSIQTGDTFQFGCTLSFHLFPFFGREHIPINGIVLIIRLEEWDHSHIVRTTGGNCMESQRLAFNRLDLFYHIFFFIDENRYITYLSFLRSKNSSKQGRTIEDCTTIGIIRHRFGVKRHREINFDTIAFFPFTGNSNKGTGLNRNRLFRSVHFQSHTRNSPSRITKIDIKLLRRTFLQANSDFAVFRIGRFHLQTYIPFLPGQYRRDIKIDIQIVLVGSIAINSTTILGMVFKAAPHTAGKVVILAVKVLTRPHSQRNKVTGTGIFRMLRSEDMIV